MASKSTTLSTSPLPSQSRAVWWLVISACCVFSALMLTDRLIEFPLYFFCDEAVQGVEAQSLLMTGKDQYGKPWPLFFRGQGAFQLGFSVYFQLPFEVLLGHSEFSIRFRNVVISVLGTIGAALIARRLYPSLLITAAVPLVFAAASFWFMHARSGFEFVISAAAWIWMVYAYDAYAAAQSRARRYAYLILVWLSFFVAFYCYTPARGWAPLSLVVLFLCYAGHHRRRLGEALLLVAGCFAVVTPFLVMTYNHPEVALGRLRDMGVRSTGALDANVLSKGWSNFLEIIAPPYWFEPLPQSAFESAQRHIVPGLPLLPGWLLPFVILGIGFLLVRFRSDGLARSILCLLPVGAFPSVFVLTNPLRCVPIGEAYLLIGIAGFCGAIHLVTRIVSPVIGVFTQAILVALATMAVLSVHDHTFNDGRYRYTDYEFYGVQAGAPQVFAWIGEQARKSDAKIRLGYQAFNGNEQLVRFYLTPSERQQVTIEETKTPCVITSADKGGLWVLRRDVVDGLIRSGCPVTWNEVHRVDDPNGRKLFAMGNLSVKTEEFEEWKKEFEELRRQPVEEEITVGDKRFTVSHTRLDMSKLEHLFDGKPDTIVRSANLNPLTLSVGPFRGKNVKKISGLTTHCAKVSVEVALEAGGTMTSLGTKELTGLKEECAFEFEVPAGTEADSVKVSVKNLPPADNFVHLAELSIEER